jgi:hypothetical protein
VLSARKITRNDKRFFGGEASPANRQPDRGSRFEATIIIRKIDDLKIVTELSPGPGFLGFHVRFNGSQAAIHAVPSEETFRAFISASSQSQA